jgi:hypothetical protein
VSDFLDINKIKFITSKAIGVEDGLEFEYDIVKFISSDLQGVLCNQIYSNATLLPVMIYFKI